MRFDVIAGAGGARHDALLLLARGLVARGVDCRVIAFEDESTAPCVACWGWTRAKVHVKRGQHTLVMERGYVGDTHTWRSLGWDGPGNLARYAACEDGGARWQRYVGVALKPWRMNARGYALILGQLETSPLVLEAGVHYAAWAGSRVAELRLLGYDVRFRPHPRDRSGNAYGARLIEGTLNDALAGAAFAVTLNSGAAIDALLAGVPTVTLDHRAMAWDVTAHHLTGAVEIERSAWAHRLAWTQWSGGELERGDFWPHLERVMESTDVEH